MHPLDSAQLQLSRTTGMFYEQVEKTGDFCGRHLGAMYLGQQFIQPHLALSLPISFATVERHNAVVTK
jgi:hypothetical protein